MKISVRPEDLDLKPCIWICSVLSHGEQVIRLLVYVKGSYLTKSFLSVRMCTMIGQLSEWHFTIRQAKLEVVSERVLVYCIEFSHDQQFSLLSIFYVERGRAVKEEE